MIDIIGTSPVSWEQAATEAMERARASVDDIRVAQSHRAGQAMNEAGKITFRIKLEVSFTMRPPHPPSLDEP